MLFVPETCHVARCWKGFDVVGRSLLKESLELPFGAEASCLLVSKVKYTWSFWGERRDIWCHCLLPEPGVRHEVTQPGARRIQRLSRRVNAVRSSNIPGKESWSGAIAWCWPVSVQ